MVDDARRSISQPSPLATSAKNLLPVLETCCKNKFYNDGGFMKNELVDRILRLHGVIGRTASILFCIVFFNNAFADVNAVSACVDIYSNTLHRFTEEDRSAVAISEMASRHCSSTGTDVGISYESESQALVKSIPVLSKLFLNANVSNKEQFCKAYKEGKFLEITSRSFLREPVVDAMKQVNSCIDIASRGIVITHKELSPGKVVFTGTPRQTDLVVRLSIAADPANEWVCISPRPGSWFNRIDKIDGNEVRRDNQPFVVDCQRDGRTDSKGDREYSPGAISLNVGSLGSYTVTLRPPGTIFGLRSAMEVNAKVEALAEEKKNLEARVASQEAQIKYFKGKTYSAIKFIFTDDPQGTAFNPFKVGCSTYHSGEEAWKPVVASRFCKPGGKLIAFNHPLGTDVNRVGQCSGNNWIWLEGVCEYSAN